MGQKEFSSKETFETFKSWTQMLFAMLCLLSPSPLNTKGVQTVLASSFKFKILNSNSYSKS